MKLKGEVHFNQYFSFRYHLLLQVVALLLITIFILSGYWQLNRAELKQKMESYYLFSLTDDSDPISLNQMTALNQMEEIENLADYRKVKVTGRYDFERQILRDNRIYQNQAGFYVFTPFFIDGSNSVILVNRGWIAMGESRNDYQAKINFNNTDSLSDSITIEGLIFKSLDRIELGEYPLGQWPVIVQNLDYQAMGNYFDAKIVKTTMRLLNNQPNGYVREWKFQTATTKQKHQAYALQWFSFALIAFAILVYKSLILYPTDKQRDKK